MFNESMTIEEAQRILFDYAANHRGENMDDIKEEFRRVIKTIILREILENEGWMTD